MKYYSYGCLLVCHHKQNPKTLLFGSLTTASVAFAEVVLRMESPNRSETLELVLILNFYWEGDVGK